MEKEKADVCREFFLVNYMNHMIWKNRTKFINVLEQNRSRIK